MDAHLYIVLPDSCGPQPCMQCALLVEVGSKNVGAGCLPLMQLAHFNGYSLTGVETFAQQRVKPVSCMFIVLLLLHGH